MQIHICAGKISDLHINFHMFFVNFLGNCQYIWLPAIFPGKLLNFTFNPQHIIQFCVHIIKIFITKKIV